MSNIAPIRTLLTMPEVQAKLGWSDNELRDALMSGQLVPSYYASHEAEVFVSNGSGTPCHVSPGVFKDGLVYAIRFLRFDAWDGCFEYVSDLPVEVKGTVLYRLWRGEPKAPRFLPLCDVLAVGGVTPAELERFIKGNSPEAEQASSTVSKSGQTGRWWNTEYDLRQSVIDERARREAGGFGMVLRGPRAGEHPRRAISEAVANRINDAEKSSGSNRSIGYNSIQKYLRGRGWI